MRMDMAGGLLVDGTAEEHLRIGALEDAGDAGAPLELLLSFHCGSFLFFFTGLLPLRLHHGRYRRPRGQEHPRPTARCGESYML